MEKPSNGCPLVMLAAEEKFVHNMSEIDIRLFWVILYSFTTIPLTVMYCRFTSGNNKTKSYLQKTLNF